MIIDYKSGFKIIEFEELKKYFMDTSKEFYPPLSERVNLSEYSSKIYDHANIIVAQDKQSKSLAGLTAFYANDFINKKAFLSNINVRQSYSGNGIAKKMIQIMHDYLIEMSFISIALEVHKSNDNAINLYKKFDYILHEEGKEYIIMKKTII